MKVVYKKSENKYYQFFSSINDLYDYLSTAKRNYDDDFAVRRYGYSTDRKDNVKWTGGYTYEESLEILKNGSKELADEIENVDIGNQVKVDRIVQSYINDIVGVIPHVPNAILGLPNSMINVVRNRVKTDSKIIDLILDASVSCCIKPETYLKVSKLFLNIVDKIENLGYRCNIYYALNSKQTLHSTYTNWMLKLKDSTEPFNKYKSAFVLGSLSMFRRIGFRLTECLPPRIANLDDYGEIINDYECEAMNRENLVQNNISYGHNVKHFNIYKHLRDTEKDIIESITGKLENEHR